MGSRLKGKRERKASKLEDWRVLKLLVYFLLTVGVLAIFAHNFFSKLETAAGSSADAGSGGTDKSSREKP